jgi:cation/acetate symporter
MDNAVALVILIAGMTPFFVIGWYSRRWTSTTAEFYVAGGQIPWRLNAVAMFSNYASAASFLGVAGAIALGGIDSWWLALGFFAAWVVVVLVLAGPLRRSGRYTVADALVERFRGREIRLLTMIVGVIIGTLYLVPQLVGAGHLFVLLLGWDYLVTVLVAGIFTAIIVVLGGMRGTTYNQAFQGVLIFGAMTVLLILATVAFFGSNPIDILSRSGDVVAPTLALGAADQLGAAGAEGGATAALAAAQASGTLLPDAPGALTPGIAVPDLPNQLSLVLGLFLGVVGLPHILIRLYTVRDAAAARKSTELTILSLAIFYTMTLFVGLAAMLLLYPQLVALLAAGERGEATNGAVALLGDLLGGQVLLGVVIAGAMAAILSSSVGLLIQMTTTVAHDGYAMLLRPASTDRERVLVARLAGIVLTTAAVLASIWLKEENVAQLVGMTFGIAASTFAPVLVLTVWWTRLTRQGVIASFLVGLVASLIFTFARFAGVSDVLGVPVLVNPALYSVPLAFAAAVVVSLLTRDVGDVERFMLLAHRHGTAATETAQDPPAAERVPA